MKKVGYFFFAFIPFLLSLGIQFLAIFFLMGIFVLFSPAVTPHGDDPLDTMFLLLSDMDFNTLIMVIFSMTCICVFALWYYHCYNGDFLPNPARTFDPLQVLAIIVFVPGTQFATSFLISIISVIFPSSWEAYQQLFESAGMSTDISALMLFYSVILAPIGEELIFRGVTMRAFRKAVPFWLANLLQAFLFGVFHMNFIQGVYAFALGILLGFICEKSGSIYYAMFFHFLFNLWGSVISEFLVIDNEYLFFAIMLITIAVSFTGGILLFYFGGVMKKKRNAKANVFL